MYIFPTSSSQKVARPLGREEFENSRIPSLSVKVVVIAETPSGNDVVLRSCL